MANGSMAEFRRKNNLSKEDLASKLGVSVNTIWRWETSRSKPHKVLLEKFERVKFEIESQASKKGVI